MPALEDLTGRAFGRLTVLHRAPNKGRAVCWWCSCSCDGREAPYRAANLKAGMTQSCGCLLREVAEEKARRLFTKHGHSKRGQITPEYRAWSNMKDRCLNQDNESYADYGGRGITICARWLDPEHGFEYFLQDLGKKPSRNLSLHRKDNDGPYSKKNCVWASKSTQSTHRRSTRLITYKNKTRSIASWARHLGLDEATLSRRLKLWTMEEAFETPLLRRHRQLLG